MTRHEVVHELNTYYGEIKMLSVQTNLGGNTALKNLNTNTLNMNNAMNKLSSGFRINSAADDAAGFAVSSK
ncbi:MAG: hypothetical protein Q9M10_01200, partial [Mariprofundaceae bacterium]|nr:hypothetical protein [Mariprofundaceae bacterium]